MTEHIRRILSVVGPASVAVLVLLRDNPSVVPPKYQALVVAVAALLISAVTPAVYHTRPEPRG